jgi:hypothetical protein
MGNANVNLTSDQWSLLLALARLGLLTKQQLQQLCLPGKSQSTFDRAMRALQNHTPPLVATHERAFGSQAAYTLTAAARESIGQHPPIPPAFCADGEPLELVNVHSTKQWEHDKLTNTALIALITQARATGLSGVGVHYEVKLDKERGKPRADAILRIERHQEPCGENGLPWLNPRRRIGAPGWVFALEADTGSETLSQVGEKAGEYRHCLRSHIWQGNWRGRYGELPIVLFVTSSPERLQRINRVWHARWPEGCWLLTTEAQLKENRWTAHLGDAHFTCRLFAEPSATTWYTRLGNLPEPEPLAPPSTTPAAQVAAQPSSATPAAPPSAQTRPAAPTAGVRPADTAYMGSAAELSGPRPTSWRTLGVEAAQDVVWWAAWRRAGRVFLRIERWRQQVRADRSWGPLAFILVGALLPLLVVGAAAVLLCAATLRNLSQTVHWVLLCAQEYERPTLAALARVALVLLLALGLAGGWRATLAWVPVACWAPPGWSISITDQPGGKLIAMTEPGEELRCSRTTAIGPYGWSWRYVRAAAASGWVEEESLRFEPVAEAQEQPVERETPTAVPPTPKPCRALRLRKMIVAADGGEEPVERLNIRVEPDLNAPIVVTIGHEDVLTGTGELVEVDGRQWTRVSLVSGQSGWASAAYIEAGQCTDSAPAAIPSLAH